MKKLLIVLSISFFTMMHIFAAAPSPVEVKEYQKDSYWVTVEYMPDIDEARILYTVPERLFDIRNAVQIVRDYARDLCREKNFSRYIYTSPAHRIHTKKGNMYMDVYIAFIKMQYKLDDLNNMPDEGEEAYSNIAND